MKIHKTIRMVSALLLLTAAAQADWNPGDPDKMHYPQLPDPFGWDVAFGDTTLADDFKCTDSGKITDVHFWVSWNHDDVDWGSIQNIHLSIHSDNPAGPNEWSQPDQLLWEGNSDAGDFRYIERFYGNGDQGWYDPLQGIVEPVNHHETWQINVSDILDPFYQKEGTIYWLDIRIDQFPGMPGTIGWKTTLDHWNDDAVIDVDIDPFFEDWVELRDPFTGESLDLAFVIVPEPSVIVMILAAGGGFIFVRHKFMI